MSNHVGPVLRITLQSALLFRRQPLLGNRVSDGGVIGYPDGGLTLP